MVVNGTPEVWTMGYLFDVILTRDPWTHRMDISRVLGRRRCSPLITTAFSLPTSSTNGRAATARTTRCVLTGPAGGTWTVGANGPHLELDAVEFCRVLSRRTGDVSLETLMSTEVPF